MAIVELYQLLPILREPKITIGESIYINRFPLARELRLFNYDIYEEMLEFMTDEMNKNANGSKCKEISDLIAKNPVESLIPGSEALEVFKKQVTDGAEWDYKRRDDFRKHTIKVRRMGIGDPFRVTPIKGDDNYLYSYDIWGNIHFGFVGMACGITSFYLNRGSQIHDAKTFIPSIIDNTIKANETQRARGEDLDILDKWNNLLVSSAEAFQSSGDDSISVNIGIELARNYGTKINKAQLHSTITRKKAEWEVEITKFRAGRLMVVGGS